MRIRIEDNFEPDEMEKIRALIGNESKIVDEVINVSNKNNVMVIDTKYQEVDVATEDKEQSYEEYFTNVKTEKDEVHETISGTIKVYSRLVDIKGTLISSAKINLYILKGLSPKLIATKLTDNDGCAIFDNLEKGSYRVIAIVDRKYFEKPTYVKWNEVNIDSDNIEATITVINKIKTNQTVKK